MTVMEPLMVGVRPRFDKVIESCCWIYIGYNINFILLKL